MLAKVWQPKLCNGNLIWKLVDTTCDLAIEANFTHCHIIAVLQYIAPKSKSNLTSLEELASEAKQRKTVLSSFSDTYTSIITTNLCELQFHKLNKLPDQTLSHGTNNSACLCCGCFIQVIKSEKQSRFHTNYSPIQCKINEPMQWSWKISMTWGLLTFQPLSHACACLLGGCGGHAPPGKFWFRSSQIASDAIWDKLAKQHFDDRYLCPVKCILIAPLNMI